MLLNEVRLKRQDAAKRWVLEALTEVSWFGNPSAANYLGSDRFAMSRSLPSLPCFSAFLPKIPHLGSSHQRSKSRKATVLSLGEPSTCPASVGPFSAPTTSLPATRHQRRSQASMTRLRDWGCEVKPARTMCHGKSGSDPQLPSMSQAKRVEPVERGRRGPQADQKRNSIPSFRHQRFARKCSNLNTLGF